MLKTEKADVIAELVERLRGAETLIVADYRGLTHKEIDGVRTRLIEQGARFAVCKNTLTRRAAEEAGVEALLPLLTGPTAIAFVVDGDMVAVAKTLDDTAKSTKRLALKGAVLSGRAIDSEGVKELASLPPVDVLRGQVLGAIIAPLTSILGLVNAPLQNLVGLIDARIDQLQAEGDTSGVSAQAPSTAEGATGEETSAVEEPAVEAEPEAGAIEEAQAAPVADEEAPAGEEPADEQPVNEETSQSENVEEQE